MLSRGDYHWQHEPCWYAVRQKGKGHWSGDRKQTTLWPIPSRDQDAATVHGTQKPVECMRRPMLNNSSPGPGGLRAVLRIGHHAHRRRDHRAACLAMELDPAYVDVAVTRWQAFTGKAATLGGDGRSFADDRRRARQRRRRRRHDASPAPVRRRGGGQRRRRLSGSRLPIQALAVPGSWALQRQPAADRCGSAPSSPPSRSAAATFCAGCSHALPALRCGRRIAGCGDAGMPRSRTVQPAQQGTPGGRSKIVEPSIPTPAPSLLSHGREIGDRVSPAGRARIPREMRATSRRERQQPVDQVGG